MQPERELRLGGFAPPSNRQMAFLDVETTGLPRLEREGEHRAIGGATRCRQLFVELCKLAWRP